MVSAEEEPCTIYIHVQYLVYSKTCPYHTVFSIILFSGVNNDDIYIRWYFYF